jgi:hypothetical protein
MLPSPAPAADARPGIQRKGTIALGRVPKKATTSSYCDHSGWGSKQGSIIRNWKRRYFVLKGLELIYFAECSQSGKGIEEKGRLKVADVEFTPDFHDALVVVGTLKNQRMVVQWEGGNDTGKGWFTAIKGALQNARREAAIASRQNAASRSSASSMEGWLFKEGQNFKSWKRRYMTLKGGVIQYAEAQGEPPKGEVRVQSVNISKARKFALDIYSDNNRILRIAGDSFETIEAWDHALARVLRRAPCFGESFSDQPAPFLGMASFLDTDCDGWLHMCGARSLAWKKRYFTLKGFVLQFSDHPGENSKGEGTIIDLKLGFRQCQLEIKLDDGKWISVAMDTDEDFNKWCHALCERLDRDPSALERVSAEAPSSRFMFNLPSTISTVVRGGVASPAERSSVAYRGSEVASPGTTTPGATTKKGWLRKEGQRMKSWKRRYFVLDGTRLHYYENIGMKTLKGGGDVVRVEVSDSQAHGLNIYFENGRVLHVAGDSAQEIRAWMESLQGPSCNPRASGSKATLARSSTLSSSTDTESPTGSSPFTEARGALDFGQGWLLKQGHNFKNWKQRYFVLHERSLSYARGVGEPPLGSALVLKVEFSDVRPLALDVTLGNGRVMTLVASMDDEFLMWCRAFKASFEYRLRAGSSLTGHIPRDDSTVMFDHDDEDEDDDEEIAILDDAPRGPTLLKKMNSDLDEIDEIDEIDGHTAADSDASDRAITANFNADVVVCSGWLRKQGGHIKSWKERFFTLVGTTLRYFKTENGPFIGGATIVHVLLIHTRKHSFEMTLNSGRKMAVLAESEGEAERWIRALKRAIAVAREEKAAAAPPAGPVGERPKLSRAHGKSSLLKDRSASTSSPLPSSESNESKVSEETTTTTAVFAV